MKHVISVLVENKFGVLARVAGLFSARGFNINSLAVGETEDPSVSRMTIVVKGDDKILDQVKKQLNKLIDVIRVKDYLRKEHIDKELVIFKIGVERKARPAVLGLIRKSSADVVKSASDIITIEITGTQDEIDKLLCAIRNKGCKIKEMVRSGRIAMEL
ncbi:MAG: acetolactate synthase small subunit [Candidatus Omnitrophica bacterium]|nr:acetolactate synthase small subunit [Candidatus Omnitrophota bacterium]